MKRRYEDQGFYLPRTDFRLYRGIRHQAGGVEATALGLDRQNIAVGLQKNPLGIGSQQHLSHRRAPAHTNDNQFRINFIGSFDDVVGG